MSWQVDLEEKETFTELDELDLPEYTEEDALADAQLEPAAESEVEPELELASVLEEEDSFTELDELDLPEYTEKDALADAQLEPAAESEVEPELGDETETLAQETESDALVADEDLLASVESAVDEVQPVTFWARLKMCHRHNLWLTRHLMKKRCTIG